MSLPTIDYSAKSAVKGLVRFGLSRMNRFVPRSWDVSQPIVQLFVHEPPLLRTRYTFVNFPSLYSPATSEHVRYELTLRDTDGRVARRGSLDVSAFGSVDCDPETVFGADLPSLGSISAQIRSGRRLAYSDKHLGKLTAHFYALYHDADMRALSVIHPQTAMWKRSTHVDNDKWASNMLIPPSKLSCIRLLQVNPTRDVRHTEIVLRSLDGGNVVASSAARMAPMSTRSIQWETETLPSQEMVYIASDSLTAPNAKPLVFLFFRNGAFSAAHS
jgi:hypothetical protein